MARGTNTFSLGAGFNITGQEPIDSRIVVSALSDLTTEETWNGVGLYNGLVVAVTESSTLYVLKNRDDVTNSESWVAVGGDVSADLAELTADVEGLKTSKQDKIIAGNGIDLNADGKTVSIKIDPAGSGLEVGPDGLKAVIPEAAEYTIAAAESPTEGYLKSYELRKNGAKVGVSIDIPKDLVVTNGQVKEVETPDDPYSGAQVGDLYLELTIANQATPVYIPVKSLTDVYTGSTYISVDAGVISVKYNDLKNQINTDLVAPISSKVTAVEGKVTALEATIGTAESGLVKDVADLEASLANKVDKVVGSGLISDTDLNQIRTNKSDIESLQTSVGGKQDELTPGDAVSITEENVIDVKIEEVGGQLLTKSAAGLRAHISSITGSKIKVGTAITGGAEIGADQTVAAGMQALSDSIRTAVAGGITSLTSPDETITVTGSGTSRGLAVNISKLVSTSSAIQIGADGKLDIFWTEID